MKIEKPDGTIEIGGSGCCCPPGQRGPGIHTNACTAWWRVNDGTWNRLRSQKEAWILAEAANTVAEFVEAMMVEDGVIRDYMGCNMPRYDWVEGTGWVRPEKRFGDTNVQEPNPSYVDSEE